MPTRTTRYILIPSIAVSVLLLAIGVGGAWYIFRASREVAKSLDDHLEVAHSTEELVLAIRELRLALDRYVDSPDTQHLEDARSCLKTVMTELPGSQLGMTATDPDRRHIGELEDLFEELYRSPEADRPALARSLMATLYEDILPTAEKHLDLRNQLVTDASERNQVIAARIGFGLLALGICGAASGLLIGVAVARSVHRSLVRISIPVQDMAGRLNEVVGPIMVEADTDLAGLDDSLRTLSEKTGDVVHRLQQSLRKSLRREQLAAVGQLAAGLAHELRNPLMSVKLILQTTAERHHPSLSGRDLTVIHDEVTRLERMLQTFLDFARPPQPYKQSVDVNQLVEATLELVQLCATQQDVLIHWTADEDPGRIQADESQLRQLLLNVLLNALDALPNGGNVWLEVNRDTLVAEDQQGLAQPLPGVKIRVADDGAGMTDEVLDKVFEPFMSTKDTGIGLGLSICQRIVESHDGRITAANRQVGGAEFSIWLPLRAAGSVSSPSPLSAAGR